MRKGYCYRTLVFIFSIALIYSCENSDPGCLDLFAENYDVFAVSECDSCCVYPAAKINIAFDYIQDDSSYNFTFNTLYPYEGNDSILISDFQLPLSTFTFYADGQSFKIRDTIRGKQPRIYDDYILKEKTSADITVGRTSFVNEVDSVSFLIGLDESATLALQPYEDIDQKSMFVEVIDEMFVDSIPRLFQARISLNIADSLRSLELVAMADPELVFPILASLKPGIAWSFPLSIDMRQVVDGIRAEDTNEVMATTISNNISKSFSIR